MPKGSGRPYNRATRTIVKGMKMANKKGMGQRSGMVPGSEGTPPGAGSYQLNNSFNRYARRGAGRQGTVKKKKK